MRILIMMVFSLFVLTACGTTAHKPTEPIVPDLVEVSKGLEIDTKLLQDCGRLPLLTRAIYTEGDVVKYNADWIARYYKCRANNNAVIDVIKRLTTVPAIK